MGLLGKTDKLPQGGKKDKTPNMSWKVKSGTGQQPMAR